MRHATTVMFAALFAVQVAAAAPAGAEVVSATDDGFVSRVEAQVPVDRFAVWSALVAPQKWWSLEHTISGKADGLHLDAQATGCLCELLPVDPAAPEGTRRSSVEHLHVVRSVPGAMLRMTGGLGPLQALPVRGVLTGTLEAKGEGTGLAFEYAVAGLGAKAAQLAPMVDKVLAGQLDRLAALLVAPPAPASPVGETGAATSAEGRPQD